MVTAGLYSESPSGKSRENYLKKVRTLVQGAEAEHERSKDHKSQRAKNEAFNRKISAQIDQDLKDYVKDFRRKVSSIA